MKNILYIFRRDVKRLWKNWVAMIVVAGVCVIPSLYAWFNIAANMDPYSHTQGIRIAVANEDAGGDTDITGRFNAGDTVIENLEKNHDLGWVFTDREEAVAGVKAGRYYAALVIPENFSRSLASVTEGKIERPEIEYYINEKKNAIAPKVTDTGATSVQQQINETFTALAGAAVSQAFSDAAEKIEGDVSGAEENLENSLREIGGILDEQKIAVGKFAEGFQEGRKRIDNARKAAEALSQAAGDSAEALSDTQKTISSVRKSTAELYSVLSTALNKGDLVFSDIGSLAGIITGDLNSRLQNVTDDAEHAADRMETLAESSRKLINDLKRLNMEHPSSAMTDIITKLESENQKLENLIQTVRDAAGSVSDAGNTGEKLYNDIRTAVKNSHDRISEIREQTQSTVFPEITRALDSVSDQTGAMRTSMLHAAQMADQMNGILDTAEECSADAVKAVSDTGNIIDNVSEKIDKVADEIGILKSSSIYSRIAELTGKDAETVADFAASPVKIVSRTLYPVKNYGSAMTPFYTSLAIWVSGIVLISIFRMEVDRDENLKRLTASQAYMGRWLLFVSVGLVQALIICLGDIFILGVQCVHPLMFVAAGLVSSFIYINIIYALSISFKHIGKAVSVILVILQIPGSAGTYPVEMMPEFFQRLHPLLPFTYGIHAMREAIAGMYSWDYFRYLLILFIYLPVSLLIGLCVRPVLLNLNHMFDEKLGETGLMICEEDGLVKERLRVATAAKILAGRDEFRAAAEERIEKFEEKYEARRRRGFFLIVFLPGIFLTLMFSISSKMVFLVLWIASIIVIACYLICLEYLNESLKRKRRFAEKSHRDIARSTRVLSGGEEDEI